MKVNEGKWKLVEVDEVDEGKWRLLEIDVG